MKILICHNFYRYRGGEAQTVFREKALLEKRGHSVVLYTRDNREISDCSLLRKSLLFFNAFFSFKTYRDLKDIIKQKPSMAHVHNVFPLISPSVYYLLKRHNIPIVQTLHNYRFICPNGLFVNNKREVCEKCAKGNFIYAVIGRCYRKSYIQSFILAFTIRIHRLIGTFKKIDVYVSPSHFLRNKMLNAGFPEKKILVKPHFVDTKVLVPSDSHENYAVFMGRVEKEKGISNLIDAFKQISEIKLKIIGSGSYVHECKNLIKQNGLSHIEYSGFMGTSKRFEILKKALFMVFPSESCENFPYVLIESLALGVPVIASRIGGIPEVIDGGKTGLFFQPGDVKGLIERILTLTSNRDLLLRTRAKSREIATQKYSEELGYKNLMTIYNKSLSKKDA